MIEHIGTFCDDDGEMRTAWYKIPLDKADQVAELFPDVRCQHSYDCCANWYPSRGKVIHKDTIYEYAIVEQRSYLNI